MEIADVIPGGSARLCGTSSICIDANSTGSYVDIVFTEPMLVRQVYYSDMFRLSDNETEQWYAGVGDAAWSQLHNGSTLNAYFATSSLTLWDLDNKTDSQQWNISITGCPSSSAEPLDIHLHGTFDSIIASFTSIQTFASLLPSNVAKSLDLDEDNIFVQRITEDKRDPLNPRVDIQLQVLGGYTITDTFHELVKGLQYWVADYSPYQCVGKVCPTGQMCVKAMCVAIATGSLVGNATASTPSIRAVANLSLTEASAVQAVGTIDRRYWLVIAALLFAIATTITLLVVR